MGIIANSSMYLNEKSKGSFAFIGMIYLIDPGRYVNNNNTFIIMIMTESGIIMRFTQINGYEI